MYECIGLLFSLFISLCYFFLGRGMILIILPYIIYPAWDIRLSGQILEGYFPHIEFGTSITLGGGYDMGTGAVFSVAEFGIFQVGDLELEA